MADFKNTFKNTLLQKAPFSFDEMALQLFRYQAENNPVYKAYLEALQVSPEKVTKLTEIPFLPIEFFKTQQIKTGEFTKQVTFKSSGTTQTDRSKHFVADLNFYLQNARVIFEDAYGPLTDFVFLGLLPSYLEQGDSSLVAMVQYFMEQSGQSESGFFLHDHQALLNAVAEAKVKQKKVVLFGVTYALLDLAEEVGNLNWQNVIIMETGGMKGRRKEIIRAELHQILKAAFGVPAIHSEYGMTELLSQAYSKGEGVFIAPKTMKFLLRDMNDPFELNPNRTSGGLNIIDLANVDSCAFIESKDIGKMHPDGSFEVLGRFDNSDIRGCNLLVSD